MPYIILRLFAPLRGLFTPTCIYPAHILPKPSTAFLPYGFNIPKNTLDMRDSHTDIESAIESTRTHYKAIVIFVGGFCDTIMCAVYREFLAFNEPHCAKIYTSFKVQHFLSTYLPLLAQCKLPIFVIAHSWGGSNFYKAMCNLHTQVHLEYLLTLDPVGYHKPTHRPIPIRFWENVYITHKWSNPRRPNIIALIGHPWNAIKVADINHTLHKPAHHASISHMIAATHFYAELTKAIN